MEGDLNIEQRAFLKKLMVNSCELTGCHSKGIVLTVMDVSSKSLHSSWIPKSNRKPSDGVAFILSVRCALEVYGTGKRRSFSNVSASKHAPGAGGILSPYDKKRIVCCSGISVDELNEAIAVIYDLYLAKAGNAMIDSSRWNAVMSNTLNPAFLKMAGFYESDSLFALWESMFY